jgi:uncharacterized LabA/DUF88 family protein
MSYLADGFARRLQGPTGNGGPLLFLERPRMASSHEALRTAIYVDGFNLYYGCLNGNPFRWVDLKALCQTVLNPRNRITKIKYFTARVSGGNGASAARQNIYIHALKAHIPELEVIYGHFLSHPTRMPPVDRSLGRLVEVMKTEEKGSDVNLAVHLLDDAWKEEYDCGIVVSNDSDLAEALRLVKARDPKKVLGVLMPLLNNGRRASGKLRAASDFQRQIRRTAIVNSQLPDPVVQGTTSYGKPAGW